MLGILIGTCTVAAVALVLAAYGLTQAAAVLGVVSALATFAIATVSLRERATRGARRAARDEVGHADPPAVPDDRSRRAA